jgi:hypothetical protein
MAITLGRSAAVDGLAAVANKLIAIVSHWMQRMGGTPDGSKTVASTPAAGNCAVKPPEIQTFLHQSAKFAPLTRIAAVLNCAIFLTGAEPRYASIGTSYAEAPRSSPKRRCGRSTSRIRQLQRSFLQLCWQVLFFMARNHIVVWRVLVLWMLSVPTASAQSAKSESNPSTTVPRSASKPVIVSPEVSPTEHPLAAVLKYARQSKQYVAQTVRNYSGRLIKRERVDGELSDYQYAQLTVRHEQRQADTVVVPFAVFVEYFAPAEIAGRKALYVDHQNDNKMLVRRGGKRFKYVVVSLDPQGPTAQHESKVPITEASLTSIIGGMITLLEQQIEADPEGTNTVVQHSPNAKLNGQPCSVIRVIHPKKDDALGFYIGTVYIDAKHHVPIRIEGHDWPDEPGQQPPLTAEYTCADMKVNAPLDDRLFEPESVRGR